VDGLPVNTNISLGTLGMFGPMLDWYINPHGGGHIEFALCGARITLQDQNGNVSNDQSPRGGAFLFGGGYEWALSDEVGLGILGRLTLADLSDNSYTHHVGALSLLASLTYN
jgi:hypothetical protein